MRLSIIAAVLAGSAATFFAVPTWAEPKDKNSGRSEPAQDVRAETSPKAGKASKARGAKVGDNGGHVAAADLPPGLAKQAREGRLPPGIAKKLEAGNLPPGLAKGHRGRDGGEGKSKDG